MAAGAFIQGASIELSADAPMREPYTVYLQGGLTFESGKLGVLLAVEELLRHSPSRMAHTLPIPGRSGEGGRAMEGLDRIRRRWRARRSHGGGRGGWLAALALGTALAALCVGLLEARLRPMTIAQAQLQNDAARLVERCVTEDLAERGLTYTQLVSIQRDASGAIVSLTTDMAAMNLLRAELVERVLDALEGVGVFQLRIPLGSLLDLTSCGGLAPP